MYTEYNKKEIRAMLDNMPGDGCDGKMARLMNRLLVAIIVLLACLMLLSCRSTKTFVDEGSVHVVEKDTSLKEIAFDYESMIKHIADSLYRKTVELDSLISMEKERLYTHTGSRTDNNTVVKDSMSIGMDSLGRQEFHYWHTSLVTEHTHDTIYKERESMTDKRRVHILTDSVAAMRENLERLIAERAYFALETMSLRDSLTAYRREKAVAQRGWLSRLTEEAGTLLLVIVLAAALGLAVNVILRKL